MFVRCVLQHIQLAHLIHQLYNAGHLDFCLTLPSALSKMRFYLLAALIVIMAEAATIPDKFFGKFVLEKSENFDEFLASKGVSWLLRKMIAFAGVKKVIAKGTEADRYNLENLTSKKNTLYHNFELNKMFQAEGLDSNMHNITLWFDNDTLFEKHIRLNEPDTSAETYRYTIEPDTGKLVLEMENNNIRCRRWFKRDDKK